MGFGPKGALCWSGVMLDSRLSKTSSSLSKIYLMQRLKAFISAIQYILYNRLYKLVSLLSCCLYREALISYKCSDCLKRGFEPSCKPVNFIKAHTLNSHLFSILHDEMGDLLRQMLLHTEVRWLSRRKAKTNLFQLHN